MNRSEFAALQEELQSVCANVHDVTRHYDAGSKEVTCSFVSDEYVDKQRFMQDLEQAARVMRNAGLSVERPMSVNEFSATFIEGHAE